MTEQNQGQDPGTAPDEKDLNSKLKKRLAIAGGLVAVALAAIPVLDGMKKPKVDMTAAHRQAARARLSIQVLHQRQRLPSRKRPPAPRWWKPVHR
jgi:hypothetical protein